jgi:serine/threonine-protein kinase
MDPARLGRYEILGKLGSGGMGTVYAARETEGGHRVALKVLGSTIVDDPEKFRRFEQEVVALSRLDHPHVVKLLGPLERDGSSVFFAMELVEGETLAARLRKDGPLPVPAALSIARSLLAALGAAHGAGVVHRDVKPSNILLTATGVKITDFGLARMEDLSRLTTTGQLMGTLDYMSPEQCEGRRIDLRTDLYSLGIVLYEMLAGLPPFRRESPGATLKGHLHDEPPSLDTIRSDLPPRLSEIVGKLLVKRPEDRIPDAASALAALDSVRDPTVTASFHRGRGPAPEDPEPVTAVPLPPDRRRRRRGLVAAGGVLLLLAAVVAGVFLLDREAGQPANGPGQPPARDTCEAVLVTIHQAIRARDFDLFASGFEESALVAFLSEEPERDFAARSEGIADFAYRLEVPMRGASVNDLSIRVGSSASLARVLGLSPAAMLRIAFRHHEDGFRVAFAGEEGRGGTLANRPEIERRMILARLQELSANFDELASLLASALPREKRVPVDELRRRLREVAVDGRIDFEVMEEASTLEGGRSSIVVRSRALARVLALPDDRLDFDFQRNLRDRRWRIRSIRPHED